MVVRGNLRPATQYESPVLVLRLRLPKYPSENIEPRSGAPKSPADETSLCSPKSINTCPHRLQVRRPIPAPTDFGLS